MMQTSTDSRLMPADTILSLGKRSYEEKPIDCKLLSTEKERLQPFAGSRLVGVEPESRYEGDPIGAVWFPDDRVTSHIFGYDFAGAVEFSAEGSESR
jgi:hypothetical protein